MTLQPAAADMPCKQHSIITARQGPAVSVKFPPQHHVQRIFLSCKLMLDCYHAIHLCSAMERGWDVQQPISLQDAQEALQSEG